MARRHLCLGAHAGSPRRADPERHRQHTEVRDHRGGQQPGAERADDRGGQDRGEPEILSDDNPHGAAPVSRGLAEEQSQDDDVIDVGDREHPHGLTDEPQIHPGPSVAAVRSDSTVTWNSSFASAVSSSS